MVALLPAHVQLTVHTNIISEHTQCSHPVWAKVDLFANSVPVKERQIIASLNSL